MSDIRKKNNIRVYNEMPTQINLVGQFRTYIFPACENGNPSMNYVDFADIEYANSRSVVFSSGLLIFDQSEQEEIYSELRINNWKDTVWFNSYIEDAINNPTVEKMQRIINITNLLTIERIRGKVIGYVNSGMSVSNKVIDIIEKRYRELSSGIMKSSIVVKAVDIQPEVKSEDVDELKKQLAEMKKMMAEMMNKSSVEATSEPSTSETTIIEEEKPKTVKKKTTASKK